MEHFDSEIKEDKWAKEHPTEAGCLALIGYGVIQGVTLIINAHEKYLEIKEGIRERIKLLTDKSE